MHMAGFRRRQSTQLPIRTRVWLTCRALVEGRFFVNFDQWFNLSSSSHTSRFTSAVLSSAPRNTSSSSSRTVSSSVSSGYSSMCKSASTMGSKIYQSFLTRARNNRYWFYTRQIWNTRKHLYLLDCVIWFGRGSRRWILVVFLKQQSYCLIFRAVTVIKLSRREFSVWTFRQIYCIYHMRVWFCQLDMPRFVWP